MDGTIEGQQEGCAASGPAKADLASVCDLVEAGYGNELGDRDGTERGRTVLRRGEDAAARDGVAYRRDLIAEERDQIATVRDRESAARDDAWAGDEDAAGAPIPRGATDQRSRAGDDRAAAADGRARAAADRVDAGRDREQAADDRAQAEADCAALAHQLVIAETDALTGARTRGGGLADLDREISRARRATGPLSIAYVDVVGLKAVNDGHGHAAGDALLERAVRAIRAHLRGYDLVVRLGGDEFLCAMSGVTIESARKRFGAVQAMLAAGSDRCEIRVGFASLAPEDTAAELIARADAASPTGHRR